MEGAQTARRQAMTAFFGRYLLHHLEPLFLFLPFPKACRLERRDMEHLVNNWCLRLVRNYHLRGITLDLQQTTTPLRHIRLPSTTHMG